MPFIIDTYNLLHVVGELPPDIAGPELPDLLDLIGRSRYRHERVILVCDGTPHPGRARPGEGRAGGGAGGKIAVRYAGAGVTADEEIARMVAASSTSRRITVVSSDRAVLREARRRRCRTMTAQVFLRALAADHRAVPPPTGRGPGGKRGSLPPELIEEAERRWREQDA